jgi:hypothetical protein
LYITEYKIHDWVFTKHAKVSPIFLNTLPCLERHFQAFSVCLHMECLNSQLCLSCITSIYAFTFIISHANFRGYSIRWFRWRQSLRNDLQSGKSPQCTHYFLYHINNLLLNSKVLWNPSKIRTAQSNYGLILSRVGWYERRKWRVLVRMIWFICILVTISLNHIYYSAIADSHTLVLSWYHN